MPFELVPRGATSTLMVWLTPVIAIGLTLVCGALIFISLGLDPLDSLYTFFIKPISDSYGISELFLKAIPLVLCGVGLAFCFRSNVWNIGAEGQLTLGAITGGGLALLFHQSDSYLLLPAMLVAGVVGGALWAGIPAFLKAHLEVNEILVSLMLNYVALLLLSYLVHGPMRDPAGYGFPESRLFHDAAMLPMIIEGTRLHLGALVALFIAAAGWVVLTRSIAGFQVRVVGCAPLAANYAGFNKKRLIWIPLLVSGGLAGLSGALEVAGPIGQLLPSVSPGYGYAAIIVAFLGRLHPIGIIFASLLLALSYLGGETAAIDLNLPKSITGVFQGMLLFFLLASDVLIQYRIRIRRPIKAG